MAFLLHWIHEDRFLYISTSHGALTLNFAGETNITFDGEGRFVGAWLDRVRYRRSLDNRVLAKRQDPQRPWRRLFRFLDPEERNAVLARVYDLAGDVYEGWESGHLDVSSLPDQAREEIHAWLERVSTWTLKRLESERERFLQVYKPVPILPPDQYMAVVLQATEGCSYNKCTFCTFYRDRPFRIKRPPEFAQHVAAVKEFLGRGLYMRRTVFLADANAVIIPQRVLLPILEETLRALPVARAGEGWSLDGIYAFISAPDALHKSADDFRAMHERHLRRVYVGLETGHDPLRRFLLKPGTAADVLDAVRTIKAGGVSVGLIFMVGVGGHTYREFHFRDTVALIQSMPLDAHDIVYASPFVASPDAPYVYDAAEAGIRPMSEDEIWQEIQRFRQALRSWARGRGVKVSYYDIREFVY